MRKLILALLAALLLVLVISCAGRQAATNPTGTSKAKVAATSQESKILILATTTSTKDTGLLDELLPAFEKKHGITVKPIAAGTGEALKMGERGDADVLLVHSRAAEDEFMAKGFGKERKDVMHNDFVLIGPKSDPVGVRKIKSGEVSAADFLKQLSFSLVRSDMGARDIRFVSRGDDSGTHKKELSLWEKAGYKPDPNQDPWYISTGQGMAATIRVANEKQAYTLSDRGTYLVQKDNIDLVILLKGSKDLLNPYGVISVNPDKHPGVNYPGATRFVEYVTSAEGQKIIGEFGKDKYGQALFVPDAK